MQQNDEIYDHIYKTSLITTRHNCPISEHWEQLTLHEKLSIRERMKKMQKYRQNGQSDSCILPVAIHDLPGNTSKHILKDYFTLGMVPGSKLHTNTAFSASHRDNLETGSETENVLYWCAFYSLRKLISSPPS